MNSIIIYVLIIYTIIYKCEDFDELIFSNLGDFSKSANDIYGQIDTNVYKYFYYDNTQQELSVEFEKLYLYVPKIDINEEIILNNIMKILLDIKRNANNNNYNIPENIKELENNLKKYIKYVYNNYEINEAKAKTNHLQNEIKNNITNKLKEYTNLNEDINKLYKNIFNIVEFIFGLTNKFKNDKEKFIYKYFFDRLNNVYNHIDSKPDINYELEYNALVEYAITAIEILSLNKKDKIYNIIEDNIIKNIKANDENPKKSEFNTELIRRIKNLFKKDNKYKQIYTEYIQELILNRDSYKIIKKEYLDKSETELKLFVSYRVEELLLLTLNSEFNEINNETLPIILNIIEYDIYSNNDPLFVNKLKPYLNTVIANLNKNNDISSIKKSLDIYNSKFDEEKYMKYFFDDYLLLENLNIEVLRDCYQIIIYLLSLLNNMSNNELYNTDIFKAYDTILEKISVEIDDYKGKHKEFINENLRKKIYNILFNNKVLKRIKLSDNYFNIRTNGEEDINKYNIGEELKDVYDLELALIHPTIKENLIKVLKYNINDKLTNESYDTYTYLIETLIKDSTTYEQFELRDQLQKILGLLLKKKKNIYNQNKIPINRVEVLYGNVADVIIKRLEYEEDLANIETYEFQDYLLYTFRISPPIVECKCN